MNNMLEHDQEAEPGIPEPLPDDERLLWQGGPEYRSFLLGSFHLRKLGLYFALLLLAQFVFGVSRGVSVAEATATAVGYALLAFLAMAVFAGYAWYVTKASLFTITSRRVILRTGIALPVTINLPYSKIESVDLKRYDDGSGDLVILPEAGSRVSWLLLWPMVKRPIRVRPVLRGIADAAAVADILADALRSSLGEQPASPQQPRRPAVTREPEPRRFRPYPTIPLAAMVSLVVIALVGATFSALNDSPGSGSEATTAKIALFFEDQDDGAVLVRDAASGLVIDRMEPGTNGFARATLRGLVRARRAVGETDAEPFAVARTETGRILLIDPVSDREIDLRAFGPTNAEVFARYLDTDVTAAGDIAAPDTTIALQ